MQLIIICCNFMKQRKIIIYYIIDNPISNKQIPLTMLKRIVYKDLLIIFSRYWYILST